MIVKIWRFSRQVLVVLSVVVIAGAEAYAQNVTSASSEDQSGQFCEDFYLQPTDPYVPPVLWFSDAFHKALDIRFAPKPSRRYNRQLDRIFELESRIDTWQSKIEETVTLPSTDLTCPNGRWPQHVCRIPNCHSAPSSYNCIEMEHKALKDKHLSSVRKLGRVFMKISRQAYKSNPTRKNRRKIGKMRRITTLMREELSGYLSSYAIAVDCET